jgi:hypothetical protein
VTCRPGAVHQPELGELGALEALGHGADRHDVDEPGAPAEVEDPLGGLGGVGDRVGVGHREHGGEAAGRGGASRSRSSRRPRGRARAGGCAGRRSRAAGRARRRRRARPGARVGVDRTDLGDEAVADEDVGGSPPRTSAPVTSRSPVLCFVTPHSPLRRAGGRGRTSAPPPLRRPGRARGCWAASAASALISRPRFIGPGWQMTASGRASEVGLAGGRGSARSRPCTRVASGRSRRSSARAGPAASSRRPARCASTASRSSERVQAVGGRPRPGCRSASASEGPRG